MTTRVFGPADGGELAPEDGDAKQIVEALIHNPEAEDIDGTTVQHVKFDLAKIDDVDEEELEEITPIIGQDGLLFRVAAADDDTIAIAFGGGSDYMAIRQPQYPSKNLASLVD